MQFTGIGVRRRPTTKNFASSPGCVPPNKLLYSCRTAMWSAMESGSRRLVVPNAVLQSVVPQIVQTGTDPLQAPGFATNTPPGHARPTLPCGNTRKRIGGEKGIVRGCAAHPSLIARDRRRQGAPTSFAAAFAAARRTHFSMFSGSNPIATTIAGGRFLRGSRSENWRKERDSNSAEAPVRSVTYCNHLGSDPHRSPRNPGFATRFATRERAPMSKEPSRPPASVPVKRTL
jgi:hypothetical protein